MDSNHLLQYLITIVKFVLRYALYGAGIALIAVTAILLLSYFSDSSVIDSERITGAVKNYLIVGATFGGIIGLLYGLMAYRS